MRVLLEIEECSELGTGIRYDSGGADIYEGSSVLVLVSVEASRKMISFLIVSWEVGSCAVDSCDGFCLFEVDLSGLGREWGLFSVVP